MARSDAQRNRQLLLGAARELFAESGDVPMYEIGRRAGVGQATLYRHFPDRDAVVLALFTEQVDRFEQLVAGEPDDPDRFLALLRAVVEAQAGFGELASCLREPQSAESASSDPRQRFIAIVEPALEAAKAAGRVRPDFRLEDVFFVLAMVGGATASAADGPEREAAGRRALTLALEGIEAS